MDDYYYPRRELPIIFSRLNRTPYAQYESKAIVNDLLALHEHGAHKYTNWQIDTLRRLQTLPRPYTDAERAGIFRLSCTVDVQDLLWGVPPVEQFHLAGQRAAREALGLTELIKVRRKRGEPKPPKVKKKPLEEKDAVIPCPVCKTGAPFRASIWKGGKLSFWCQNSHCVKS